MKVLALNPSGNKAGGRWVDGLMEMPDVNACRNDSKCGG